MVIQYTKKSQKSNFLLKKVALNENLIFKCISTYFHDKISISDPFEHFYVAPVYKLKKAKIKFFGK